MVIKLKIFGCLQLYSANRLYCRHIAMPTLALKVRILHDVWRTAEMTVSDGIGGEHSSFTRAVRSGLCFTDVSR